MAAWTLNYDASHRLSSVDRPDGSDNATTTVAYGVPISGSSAPVDLSVATAATWSQSSDLPLTGTAVFGPNHVPAAAPTSTDWPYASISYLDVNGQTVNSAQYGAGQWLVDTTRYDQHGNTVTPAQAAELLASTSVYNADGSELLDSYGPIHPVQLSNGTLIDARSHSHTTYDEGAPSTGGPYQLTTTATSTVQDITGTDYDARITHTGYGIINSADPNEKSGWELRKATTTTTQMGTSPNPSADLIRTTRYDLNGKTIELWLPTASSSGGTAGATITSYYTATGTGPCVSVALAGMLCSTGPAAQPTTGNPLPVTTTTYNLYNQPLVVSETAASTVRTTTTSYDTAGRTTSTTVAVTPSASGGTALPSVTTSYDTSTGLATTVTGGGKTLTTGYDALGRVTSYTDATGNTATTTYDNTGHVLTVSDGKGTRSYTYDSAIEHRGMVTSEDLGVGAAPGTITVSYDASGNAAAVTYPNGLIATTDYDNTDTATSLTYTRMGSTWIGFTQTPGSDGNTAAQTGPASSQQFGHDAAGRLTQTQDTVPDSVSGTVACTTRVYNLDKNSNRVGLDSYPDDGSNPTTGNCTTSTTPTTWTGSYDEADRLAKTGYSYDTFGRTTTVPAVDAQGIGNHAATTGDLTLGYYANDYVAVQTQGGRTLGFTLDPLQNRVIDTTDSGGTNNTNHYADSSDSPAWTTTGTTTWTRNLIGPFGLVGTIDQTGIVTVDLPNMHGDIVATSADDPAATGISSYSEATEFGTPRIPASALDTYGWLGTRLRSSDSLGGLTIMGVRMYSSSLGRFLSVDPVRGGNDNAYGYPSNPLNSTDLTGKTALPD